MRGQRIYSGWILLSSLVTTFLLFDAVAPVVLAQHPTHLAALMGTRGVVIAQSWLLAVWTALGRRPWFERTGVGLRLSTLSVSLYEHGLIHVAKFGYTPEIPQVVLAPMELIVLTLPLLLMRMWRGRRLAAFNGNSDGNPQRFSLRQLFLATAIAAGAFGLAQFGMAEFPDRDFRMQLLVSDCVQALLVAEVIIFCPA